MFYHQNSKAYVLCMIFACYVIYVMIVNHALIVKFYPLLVCLFWEAYPYVVICVAYACDDLLSDVRGEQMDRRWSCAIWRLHGYAYLDMKTRYSFCFI